jgi:hypothetical protein
MFNAFVFEELPKPPRTRSGVDALGKRDQAMTRLLGSTQALRSFRRSLSATGSRF